MKTRIVKHPSNEAVSVTLHSAQPEDEPFLFEVYASTRLDEVAAWGWNAAQQQAFLRMQFSAQQRTYPLESLQDDHWIILLNERRIGRIIIFRTDDELRLADIALLPEYRNAGIGTLLIQDLLAEAAAVGKPVRLRVLQSNSAAARLYERLGFVKIGESDSHFQMEWRPHP